MGYVTVRDPRLALWMSQEVERVATAPPRVRMNYDTIESYMKVRLHDVATKSVFLGSPYPDTPPCPDKATLHVRVARISTPQRARWTFNRGRLFLLIFVRMFKC